MAERLSVDIVYHFLPSYRESVFRELLAADDLDVRLVSGVSRPSQEHVPVAESLPYTSVTNRWLGMVLWQSGLFTELRRRKPDVVIFLGSWNFASTWVMALLARLSGRTVLFWTHGWQVEEVGARSVVRRAFYRLADGLLLYGERAQAIGQSQGFDPGRLFVVGNSLSVEAPAADRAIATDTDPPMILWVARLLDSKRLDLLIDAFVRARQRGHELRLVVVGEGPAERPAVDDATAEHVDYLGAIHDDEVLRDLFDRASVVAIPASAGLTVLHALLHGTPVVVNDDPRDNGPEYEFVDVGRNGSTFPAGDAEALADELIRWTVTQPASTAERSKIAAAGALASSPSEVARRIREALRAVEARPGS